MVAFKKNSPGCTANAGCQCTESYPEVGFWNVDNQDGPGSQFEFGKDGTRSQHSWVLFANIAVDQGQPVASAKIRMYGPNSIPHYRDDNCNVRITGCDMDTADILEDSDDFEAYFAIVDRTTATVDWNAVENFDAPNTPHDTPELATIVQEIVNRPGWANGNDIMFIIEDNASDTDAFRRTTPSSSFRPALMIVV